MGCGVRKRLIYAPHQNLMASSHSLTLFSPIVFLATKRGKKQTAPPLTSHSFGVSVCVCTNESSKRRAHCTLSQRCEWVKNELLVPPNYIGTRSYVEESAQAWRLRASYCIYWMVRWPAASSDNRQAGWLTSWLTGWQAAVRGKAVSRSGRQASRKNQLGSKPPPRV